MIQLVAISVCAAINMNVAVGIVHFDMCVSVCHNYHFIWSLRDNVDHGTALAPCTTIPYLWLGQTMENMLYADWMVNLDCSSVL